MRSWGWGPHDRITVSLLHTNLEVGNFLRCECSPICQQLYYTTVLFKVLYCKIKNVFFIFCVGLCIICVLSMVFSRQEYWGGLPFPPSGDFPDPGIKPAFPASPALQVDSLPLEPPACVLPV